MAAVYMLPPLRLVATPTTPYVYLDAQQGPCVIEGRSMPADAHSFFEPVLSWIGNYARQPRPKTEFIINLDYFNSASSLMLSRIVNALGDVRGLQVHWHYHPDDEDTLEAGQELARMAMVPFTFVSTEG